MKFLNFNQIFLISIQSMPIFWKKNKKLILKVDIFSFFKENLHFLRDGWTYQKLNIHSNGNCKWKQPSIFPIF